MADIPAQHFVNSGDPSDQRIASALETIAKAQIAQAEDLRDLCRLVSIVANMMK